MLLIISFSVPFEKADKHSSFYKQIPSHSDPSSSQSSCCCCCCSCCLCFWFLILLLPPLTPLWGMQFRASRVFVCLIQVFFPLFIFNPVCCGFFLYLLCRRICTCSWWYHLFCLILQFLSYQVSFCLCCCVGHVSVQQQKKSCWVFIQVFKAKQELKLTRWSSRKRRNTRRGKNDK